MTRLNVFAAPCALCGRDVAGLEQSETGYWIECGQERGGCGAHSYSNEGEAKAVANWNFAQNGITLERGHPLRMRKEVSKCAI